MASCAIEGCRDPACPVCRFNGRSADEIQRTLRREWQQQQGIEPDDTPRRTRGTSGTRQSTRRTKTLR